MKIVIAPDSFKESISAVDVAVAIENGFKRVLPEADIIKIPMADGGEGTVDSLVKATGGNIIYKKVTGPLGEPVNGYFGMLGDGRTAVIEMAAASGIHLVPPEKRNPLMLTTRGIGELILEALHFGASHMIVGLGGSATVDGGIGMAKALGVRFLDQNGNEIPEGGNQLINIETIDVSNLDPRLKTVTFDAACDVENPLIGNNGAAAVFGPQKGATPEMIKLLDENLAHYAKVIAKDLGKEIACVPGAGAAGGLGGGLLAFLNADMKKGVDILLDATNFREKVRDADLVITGEGKIDSQTIYGKTPIGVAKIAKSYDVPVIAIAANVMDDSEAVYDHGIDAVFSVLPRLMTLEEAMDQVEKNIERLVKNIAILFRLMKLK